MKRGDPPKEYMKVKEFIQHETEVVKPEKPVFKPIMLLCKWCNRPPVVRKTNKVPLHPYCLDTMIKLGKSPLDL